MQGEFTGPTPPELDVASSDGIVTNNLEAQPAPSTKEATSRAPELQSEEPQLATVEQEKTPYTPKELDELRGLLREKRAQLSEIIFDDQSELSISEKTAMAKQAHEKATQEILDQLLREKERFQSIFKTEHGSTYFVTETGQALRFKIDEEEGLQIKPLLNKIVYLDDDVKQDLFALYKKRELEHIVGIRIPIGPVGVGKWVFEFGGIYPKIDTEFEVGQDAEGQYLRIWGNHIPEEEKGRWYGGSGSVPPEDRQPAAISLKQLVEYQTDSPNIESEEMQQYWEKYGNYEFGGLIHFGHTVTEIIK